MQMDRIKPGRRAALALALIAGLASSLAVRTAARAQSSPASVSGHQAASCTALPKPPNTLLQLAECCAHDLKSNPSCRVHDHNGGYVIIKDNAPQKTNAYLIMPTTKVTGIEDHRVSSAPVVDFWHYGWSQSARFPGRQPADTALAINSINGRDQDQLHIHISCIRADVKHMLHSANVPSHPQKPAALQLPPHQNTYEVVKVTGLNGSLSPFLLIQANPAAKADMKDQSIAVVGSSKANEYFVLRTYHHGANPGHAEELLSQSCS